jgi:hypothetical protein
VTVPDRRHVLATIVLAGVGAVLTLLSASVVAAVVARRREHPPPSGPDVVVCNVRVVPPRDEKRQQKAIDAMDAQERAKALLHFKGEAYVWAETVVQQARRLRDPSEPAVEHMGDGRLLGYALRATLRAAKGCARLAEGKDRAAIEAAMERFNAACPDTVNLRDAVEHFDDYLLNVGKQQKTRPGTYTQLYERSATSAKVHVGDLIIDADNAERAALHLANVVIAGKDYLELL